MYHFLIESKPHERIDPLITASEFLPDKKEHSNSNEKRNNLNPPFN